jgi:hypothetical protein
MPEERSAIAQPKPPEPPAASRPKALQGRREVGLGLLSRHIAGAAFEQVGAAPDDARLDFNGLLGLALDLQGARNGGAEGVKPGLLDRIYEDTLQQERRDGRDRLEVERLRGYGGSAHLPR